MSFNVLAVCELFTNGFPLSYISTLTFAIDIVGVPSKTISSSVDGARQSEYTIFYSPLIA